MSYTDSILAAVKTATSNRYGLLQMDQNLKTALLLAEANGKLTITQHNANYCTLQGEWSTPAKLIQHASHFEMLDDKTIMLKQGSQKMRAFTFDA